MGGVNPPLATTLLLLHGGVNQGQGLKGLLLLRWGGLHSKRAFKETLPHIKLGPPKGGQNESKKITHPYGLAISRITDWL